MLKHSIVAVLLTAGLAFTQDADRPIRIGTKLVVAPTVVRDHHGEYVSGLQTRDFSLTDNGKPQDIKVTLTSRPGDLDRIGDVLIPGFLALRLDGLENLCIVIGGLELQLREVRREIVYALPGAACQLKHVA